MALSYAPRAAAQAIYGAAECIEIIPNGYRANFSYESLDRIPTLVAVGASNNISPGAADQGQITTFYQGYNPRAFRVDVLAAPPATPGAITWNFLGKSFSASLATPRCRRLTSPPVMPVISLLSGANQATTLSTAFVAPIVIQALLDGRPLKGLTLEIRPPVTGASGVAGTPLVTTDNTGRASFNITANATAGTYAVTVAAPSPVVNITFILTNQ